MNPEPLDGPAKVHPPSAWASMSPLARAIHTLETDGPLTSDKGSRLPSLGITSNLFRGVCKLNAEYPSVLQCLLAWPDQIRAERMISTFGQHGLYRDGKPTLWTLLLKVNDDFTAEQFVVTINNTPKYLVHSVVALPVAMLPRASRIAAHLTYAFQADPHKRGTYHPIPSVFFPGISKRLDDRLLRENLDTETALLTEMATLPEGDQYLLLDRLQDRDAALRFIRTPQWRRPLLTKTPETEEVWNMFQVLSKLDNIAIHSRTFPTEEDKASAIRSTGVFYQQIALKSFGNKRWPLAYDVIWGYGFALQYGPIPTYRETVTPPWEANV